MNINYTNEQRYFRAVKKVKTIKALYLHAAIYSVIIPVIIYTNLKYTPHYHWFWFSTLGWGVGLLSHAFQVFEWYRIFLGKDWEERKIREIIEKNE